jgi:hypothetical protein
MPSRRCGSVPQPTCEFLLDYVEEEEENDVGDQQQRKLDHYHWPCDFCDAVVTRLLALNKEQAEQERLGATADKKPKGKATGPGLRDLS